jgi:hypothetical protein
MWLASCNRRGVFYFTRQVASQLEQERSFLFYPSGGQPAVTVEEFSILPARWTASLNRREVFYFTCQVDSQLIFLFPIETTIRKHRKEENQTQNLTTPVVSEIHTKQSTNEGNSSMVHE